MGGGGANCLTRALLKRGYLPRVGIRAVQPAVRHCAGPTDDVVGTAGHGAGGTASPPPVATARAAAPTQRLFSSGAAGGGAGESPVIGWPVTGRTHSRGVRQPAREGVGEAWRRYSGT